MGKFIQSIIMILLFLPLWGMESIILDNEAYVLQQDRGYISLQVEDKQPVYSNDPGEPAIPLGHHYFIIPANNRIVSIQIIPIQLTERVLSTPLIPVQKAYPLSFAGTPEFTMPNDTYSLRGNYPDSYLSHYGDGFSGGVHIGYVTYYTGQYEPISRTLYRPEQFRLEITYAYERNDSAIHQNIVTNDVLSTLGLETPRADSDTTGYLLIYPATYANVYAPLVEWRRKQGLRVFTQTVESIDADTQGIDLQQKIRSYIHTLYDEANISYVTLGADTDRIPDRKFFAFDCHYGYMDGESDIPADMYYANLDGSFDANNNGIYGEDIDMPDYFPEVYVGRISASNETEITDYVNRLIIYEQGYLPDYNKSIGFSMDLWTGSNSVVSQEYILAQFFPPYYQNTLLNQEDNIVVNALSAMGQNPNIIQHTGHASQNVLSLRHGYIDTNFMTQLSNTYGGLFYSIGCLAEAIDYPSIGEKMVMTPGKGMLAFVGNSRFGWGAPIAPGFGYSEFFQKEFFRLLFHENINHIGAANAMQKIPFIPYFAGTSVYKWCAYELNEAGDSYFRLFTDNPKPLAYHVTTTLSGIKIIVSSNEIPLSKAAVRFEASNLNFLTDLNGAVSIPTSLAISDSLFSIYAEGYQTVLNGTVSITDSLYISEFAVWITSNHELIQGQSYGGAVSISNMTNMAITTTVYVEADSSIIDTDMIIFTKSNSTEVVCPPNSIYTIPLAITLASIHDSRQLPNGYAIPFRVRLARNNTVQRDQVRTFEYHILAPDIVAENLVFASDALIPGTTVPFTISFTQDLLPYMGDARVALDSNTLSFQSNEQNIHFSQDTDLIAHGFIGNYVTIPRSAENGQIIPIHLSINTLWLGQEYFFETYLQVPIGRLNYHNTFQDSLCMIGDPAWQMVLFQPINPPVPSSLDYVLSCRPSQYGTYTISSPSFLFQDNTKVSFDYSYKMPMYGQDGVFVKLVHNDISGDLIFLGSGGALGRSGDADYITSDLSHYELDISTLPLQTMQAGDLYHIEFAFVYADTSGFNNYADMPDVGVFIDDLQISNSIEDIPISEMDVPPIQMHLYPNPIDQFAYLKIDLLSWRQTNYELEIFNIRGQKVYRTEGMIESPQVKRLIWDKVDDNKQKVASGIYVIKVKSAGKEVIRKFTIVK